MSGSRAGAHVRDRVGSLMGDLFATAALAAPVVTGSVAAPVISGPPKVALLATLPRQPSYRLWFDGSASAGGNGSLACGFVVEHPDGDRYRAPFLAGEGSNNEAEYAALIAGLRYLAGVILDGATVTVHGDSSLVINQVFGTWKVRALNLRPFHAEAQALVRSLAAGGAVCKGEWISREKNKEADALCRQARTSASATLAGTSAASLEGGS